MALPQILVVDDEPDILELIGYDLARHNYDMTGVASGEEALVSVRKSLHGSHNVAALLAALAAVFGMISSLRVSRSLRAIRASATGLGLAIVKHIVQIHDGQVEVRSKTGQGSTFSLRLPAPQSSLNAVKR